MTGYLTEADLYMCKYATAREDKDGFIVPYCKLCGLSCDDVLRYGDEGCKYTKGEQE